MVRALKEHRMLLGISPELIFWKKAKQKEHLLPHCPDVQLVLDRFIFLGGTWIPSADLSAKPLLCAPGGRVVRNLAFRPNLIPVPNKDVQLLLAILGGSTEVEV